MWIIEQQNPDLRPAFKGGANGIPDVGYASGRERVDVRGDVRQDELSARWVDDVAPIFVCVIAMLSMA